MVFFIADTHFGDRAVIDRCRRPFDSVDEMELFMIEAWNGRVGEDDTVYVIGDMFHRHKDPESMLKQLKGKKRLIVGEHDGAWMRKLDLTKHFLSVDTRAEVLDGERRLVLCHYPLMSWSGEPGCYMIHGHVHNDRSGEYWPHIKNDARILNAGVDVNGFWPVTFEQLVINNECFKAGIELGEPFISF